MRVRVRIGFKQHCRNKKRNSSYKHEGGFYKSDLRRLAGFIHLLILERKNNPIILTPRSPRLLRQPALIFTSGHLIVHLQPQETGTRPPGVTDAFAHGFILGAQIYFKNRYVTSNKSQTGEFWQNGYSGRKKKDGFLLKADTYPLQHQGLVY